MKYFNTLRKCLTLGNKGNMGVEFALIVPVLIVIIIAVSDVSRYYILNIKLERAAFTIAEQLSQSKPCTNVPGGSQSYHDQNNEISARYVTEIFRNAARITSTQDSFLNSPNTVIPADVRIFYTSVSKSAGGAITTLQTLNYGTFNVVNSLPSAATLSQMDNSSNYLIIDGYVQYRPLFINYFGSQIIKSTYFIKPRFGTFTATC